VVMTEKTAAVYQRGRWLVSNVSDVRIIWNITTGVGRLKLVECHQPHPHEDTLYQIYILQTTTDYHLLIVTLLA
jgi:hypothetical protein